MPATLAQTTKDALNYSDQERAKLAHVLLLSLDPDENPDEMEAAWEAEITMRVDRITQGVAKGRDAEDIFRDIRARHS